MKAFLCTDVRTRSFFSFVFCFPLGRLLARFVLLFALGASSFSLFRFLGTEESAAQSLSLASF